MDIAVVHLPKRRKTYSSSQLIQFMEEGGEALPAGQQGEPQIHQVLQATQDAEPSLHQPLPYQQQVFRNRQMEEISLEVRELMHQLPLARIKKIMKANEDVEEITADALAVLAKACELFIVDLIHRSWIHTEDNGRCTLQRNDIESAITSTESFDFLVGIVTKR